MMKYKILVIDDDLEHRRKGYLKILGEDYFDIKFVENASIAELEKIRKAKVHAFILDVNLDKWSYTQKSALFMEVTKLIGDRAPVFLISNYWNQDNIGWVNHSKDVINIRHYISWDNDFQSILDTQTEVPYCAVRANIKRELDEFHVKEEVVLDENQSIKILQISDLQFGDKSLDNDTRLLEETIPQYLYGENIDIDLVVFAGDVVFSGLPSEFQQASKWLSTFCFGLFKTTRKPRLLLIPGNHDVNMRLNSADLYRYSFVERKLVEQEKDQITDEHHTYGLAPFREFAYEMTNDPSYLDTKNDLCFVNDRFLNWGLRFYHLNSVSEQNYENPVLAKTPQKSLAPLLRAPDVPEETYKIILSHHDPQSIGYDPMGNWTPEWHSMSKFIQGSKADLYLHGHKHFFKTYSFQGEGADLDNIRFHMTGTLSLSISQRMQEAKRGFSIIEIPRQNGIIQKDKVTVSTYHIEAGQVTKVSERNIESTKLV